MTNMRQLDEIQRSSQVQFDRQSPRYAKGHILADVADVVELIGRIPPRLTKRALDVATGAGHTGLYLAANGWEVTLADISAEMLERASELAAERALQVETRQHAAEALPYADASFDPGHLPRGAPPLQRSGSVCP